VKSHFFGGFVSTVESFGLKAMEKTRSRLAAELDAVLLLQAPSAAAAVRHSRRSIGAASSLCCTVHCCFDCQSLGRPLLPVGSHSRRSIGAASSLCCTVHCCFDCQSFGRPLLLGNRSSWVDSPVGSRPRLAVLGLPSSARHPWLAVLGLQSSARSPRLSVGPFLGLQSSARNPRLAALGLQSSALSRGLATVLGSHIVGARSPFRYHE